MERYPIGSQDFKGLREGGFVYVDKTHFIPNFIGGSKYYFLARPRRFGKSLFLSTLEYFFKGERNLFRGLAIEKYDWNWKEYPVIHLDLNGGIYTKEVESLTRKLNFTLHLNENQYNLEGRYENPSERFQDLIIRLYQKFGEKVIVLVDEYEKPVLDALDHPELSDSYKDTLRGFYAVLKSADRYLKLVLITGVTKFGQMNIFSGLNNIYDISLNPEFGSLCGITTEELISNFPEGITNLAKEEETDFEGALQLLKENYDGYHFSRNCPDIYNPYSLLNAFADRFITAYWSFTGTPSLLATVLKQQNYDLESLDGVKADPERLMGINNRFNDPVALFYQTGYLTIKSYDKISRNFTLGYPNQEVEKAFFRYLLPNYSGLNPMRTYSFMDQFKESLDTGNVRKAMEVLEEFSASISYDVVPKAEMERHFQYLVYIVTKLLSSRRNVVKVEEKTSDGRMDLLIATPDYIYIIEIKKDSDPTKALKQIEEKEYALQYRNEGRVIYKIGMNFSTDKKRLDGFVISD